MNKVSIIIPVLNEQGNIESLVKRIDRSLSLKKIEYEVIFIDDHSTDNTRGLVVELSKYYPLSIYLKKGGQGKAASLIEGFSYAKNEIVCMIDADLQYPPEAIPEMFAKVMIGADIVVGNRVRRRVGFFMGKVLHGLQCDVQSGLKLFRKEIVERIVFNPSPWSFDLEFLVNARNAGYSIVTHDIEFSKRSSGKTKGNFFNRFVQIGLSALKIKFSKPAIIPFHPNQVRQSGEGYHYKGKAFLGSSDEGAHSSRANFFHTLVVIIAFLVVILFGLWWFSPLHIPNNFTGKEHFLDIILFSLVSYIIWHPFLMEALTWVISTHIKPLPYKNPPNRLKVAFITTIVPEHESVELLHKVLPAMVNADYPHDTWLLDEGNSAEVKAICEKFGVKHFSRRDKQELNTKSGKFTKTKGGNHNSWYEVEGNKYDIVAQIDTDFVPERTFLTRTLGYFEDPKVAFVGTPQIYGNTEHSLVARGAAEQQYSFYGPILQGLGSLDMSLMIGANHVVRVAALKSVNHYAAHITEDLITGMKLHSKGWKSIYVPQALAIGEGPFSWEAYFNQQMRWAYGCIDILFHHSPKLFLRMGLRRVFYYFLLQQYYFSGLVMALSIVLLSLYFAFGLRAANVDLVRFVTIYSLVLFVTWLVSVWIQRFHISGKGESELFIAGKIISIAAWPIYFIAFICVFLRKRLTYKVTPKGENGHVGKTSLKVFLPHIIFGVIAALCIVSSFFTHRQSPVMIFWAFFSALLMLSLPFAQTIDSVVSKLSKKINRFGRRWYDLSVGKMNSVQGKANVPTFMEKLSDILFLSCIVILSFCLYLPGLGFYSDDWSFLGNFKLAHDQSLIGLFQTATTPNTFMRPVQNFYDALLYFMFGMNPFWYHLVNGVVFIGIIVLFYLVLSKLKLPRVIALTVPLVFALLPNYSTDRFWYAAFQINLSMFFFFLSLYIGLRAVSKNAKRVIFWKLISIICLIISILSYEVVLPLVLVSLFLFWKPLHHLGGEIKRRLPGQAVFITVIGIVLLYLIFFKVSTTIRLGTIDYPEAVINIILSSFTTNYGTLGFNLPFIWGEIASNYMNPLVSYFGGILFFAIFFYVYSLFEGKFPKKVFMCNLLLSGIVIFILGYAVFYSNNIVGFSATGIDNRVAIAASVGIALTFVGIVGLLAGLIPFKRLSRFIFSVWVAVICTGGFFIINTLAKFWVDANYQQQAVLADIYQYFPSLPKGSTLILDGVCPYKGPGVVFESQWDLRGALQVHYGDPSIRADIVTPRLKVENDAIYTQIYTFKKRYAYSDLLIVYNYNEHIARKITDAKTAREYIQDFNNNTCPSSSAGSGVKVF